MQIITFTTTALIYALMPDIFYGLSIARAFKAHSELGVVFNPSSAFAQSNRRIYPA